MRISLKRPALVEVPVELEEGTFRLQCEPVTKGDLITNQALLSSERMEDLIEFRLSKIIGWADLENEDGSPIPFNNQTVDAVLSDPDRYLAVANAVYSALFAPKGAPEKNLRRSVISSNEAEQPTTP